MRDPEWREWGKKELQRPDWHVVQTDDDELCRREKLDDCRLNCFGIASEGHG